MSPARQAAPLSLRVPPLLQAQLDLVLAELARDSEIWPGVPRNKHAVIIEAIDRGMKEVLREISPQARARVAKGIQSAAAKPQTTAAAQPPTRRAPSSKNAEILLAALGVAALAAAGKKITKGR